MQFFPNISVRNVTNKTINFADTKTDVHRTFMTPMTRLLTGENEQWLCPQKIVEKFFSDMKAICRDAVCSILKLNYM